MTGCWRVATKSHTHADIQDLDDLGSALLDEIEQFFANYTGQRGKTFKPLGRIGAKKARKIVEHGMAAFDKQAEKPCVTAGLHGSGSPAVTSANGGNTGRGSADRQGLAVRAEI